MLIELTQSRRGGRESVAWQVCPEMIVGISKGDRIIPVFNEAGQVTGEATTLTRIDVIYGGEYYVKETPAEVCEKREAALGAEQSKIMLGKDGQLAGWIDTSGEFHEAKAEVRISGSSIVDLSQPEEEVACPDCRGRGWKEDAANLNLESFCNTCNGRGKVRGTPEEGG